MSQQHSDRPVVGILGNSPPPEVIVAAGAQPVLVRPDPHGSVELAEPYLDHYIDAGVRNVLDRAIRGGLDHIDLLVCDGSDDRLYHFMKEVVRLGKGEHIPPLYLYDLLQSGSPADTPYNLMHLRNLIDRLQALTRTRADDAALSAAIHASNQGRAVKRRVAALRCGERPLIAGGEAADLLRSTRGLDPSIYGSQLTARIRGLTLAPRSGPRVMLIPAAELHDDAVHRLLEEAGAVVTVEDDISGARSVTPDIATQGDPLEAIAARLYDDVPGPQMHPQERRFAWTFEQLAAPYVEAVVFYIPPSDHDFGWSFPRLRAVCERLGKPHLLVREDAYAAATLETLKSNVAQFVKSLPRSAS
jgi:benzoyl-CoA reductase/2-hydroxyglutaryl-CoA dehydratase subunit BcrC/BadD/HgdB